MDNKPSSEFEKTAARQSSGGLFSEFWHFLSHNKKWWLLPILLLLLVFAVMMVLGSTGVAPFIYTLF
jgi:hypothetical protein